ncbi:unnamed protein product, partial [Chrysoparadoxa australica]
GLAGTCDALACGVTKVVGCHQAKVTLYDQALQDGGLLAQVALSGIATALHTHVAVPILNPALEPRPSAPPEPEPHPRRPPPRLASMSPIRSTVAAELAMAAKGDSHSSCEEGGSQMPLEESSHGGLNGPVIGVLR